MINNLRKTIFQTNRKKESLLMNSVSSLNRVLSTVRDGLTHMGKRDLYKVFGYQRIIRKDDYNGKYRRSIAFRIVNAYPDASWREFPKITDDGDSEEETTFEKQVSDAVEILKLDSVFKKADKAANLGRFSVLFIGIRDGESDLRQPVREGIYDISDIMHLTPYPESCVTISSFNQDPTSPRFGLPELYQLTTRNDENSTRTNVGLGIEVHWTRVIHIAENSIENEVYGIPRLEPVYNYLDNIDKVIGGSSETFWLNSRGGLHVNSEADVSFDTDSSSSDNLQKNLDEYTHNLTRYIKTRGLDVNPIEFNIADPKSNFETNISLISGTTGIPQRILTGSERGELASSSDDKNWNNRVVERRDDFCTNWIIRQFVDWLINYNIIESPKNDKYDVIWPTSVFETALEQADIALKKANALDVYSRGDSQMIMAPKQFTEELLKEEFIEDSLPDTQDFDEIEL